MSSIIERVETFIQRLNDLDYVIVPEATKILYSSALPFSKERRPLSDCLANAISEYQMNKDNEKDRFDFAHACSVWINRGFTCGVIQEGQGLARKLKECQEKNVQLEKDIEKLSEEYVNLKKLHEMAQFAKYVELPREGDSEDKNEPSP